MNNVALTPFLYLYQAPGAGDQAPWWLFWLLAIIGVLSALIWWLVERGEEKSIPAGGAAVSAPAGDVTLPEPEPAMAAEAVAAAESVAAASQTTGAGASSPGPDDLTRIEGIGPKSSRVLQAAGLTTFAQLAASDVSRIQQILEASDLNYRLVDPTTWPEQASLAAKAEWEALEKLQDELKGGRRVD